MGHSSNLYQTLYLNLPLYTLYSCQILRQSDFVLKSCSNFCKCVKKIIQPPEPPEKEKNEKTIKVWPPISHEWLLQTNQNFLRGVLLVAGSYNAKFTCFFERVMSYACVKIAFEFFLLITNWYYQIGFMDLEIFF